MPYAPLTKAQKSAVFATILLTIGMGFGVFFAWHAAHTQDTHRNPAYTQPDRLVKLVDAKEIYAIFGQRKHVLQNPTVFASYGYSYDEVQGVAEADLEQYPLARVVRVPGEPEIYYLDYAIGRKKAHPTYEVFLAYGNADADVILISPTDRDSWPDVELIRDQSNGKIYLLEEHKKRLVLNMDIFNAYGYVLGEVAEVAHLDAASYPDGEPLPYPSAPFATTPVATERIIVTPASFNIPNQRVLISGTMYHEALAFTLTAPAATDAAVHALTITQKGLTPDAAFFGIELVDENGLSLAPAKPLQNKKATFRLREGVLAFDRGTHRTITVLAHMNPGDAGAFTDAIFQLTDETAIAGTLPVTGAFPLAGETLRVTDGSNLVGRAVVRVGGIDGSQSTAPVGSAQVSLLKLTIEETSGREGLLVEMLKLTLHGSASVNVLERLTLTNTQGAVVRPAVALQNDRTLYLDLQKSPLKIDSGSVGSWTLAADITGGSGSTVNVTVEAATDARVRGTEQRLFLLPTLVQLGATPTIAISEGGVLFYRHEQSPHGDVPAGTTDVVLANVVLLPVGEELALQSFRLQIIPTPGALPLPGDVTFTNTATKKVLASVIGRNVTGNTVTVSLDDQILPANKAMTFSVHGNFPEGAVADDAYTVRVSDPQFVRTRDPEGIRRQFTLDAQVNGNSRGIKNGLLIATGKTTDVLRTVPVGSTHVPLAVFTLRSGEAESVVVHQLTLNVRSGLSVPVLQSGFTNVEVLVNGRVVSKPQTLLGFPLTVHMQSGIKAGASVQVVVRADVLPPADGETVGFQLTNIGFSGSTSKETLSLRGLPIDADTTFFRASTVALTEDPGFASPATVTSGAPVRIASFLITSTGAETLRLTRLVITASRAHDEFNYLNGYHNLEVRLNGKTISRITDPLPEQNIVYNTNSRGGIVIGAAAVQKVEVFITPPESAVGDTLQAMLEDIRIHGSKTNVYPAITGDPTKGQVVIITP
ncbi:MAG: hypothetical protein COT39_00820 [Parcubacteria group bacterium CG08_land_8_20_14_0_20_48_21]|nr:MAG: hypothetical protein AUK21_01125 [Parcubacteria group bacterium CG2_30_48_51]PIS33136.1 MAG: hypothetical protein COT39_00820 [Parcubacteria group bacterium CG08_land_8_20_14_0_20_48_21]PIW79347.1 MAG: hypothetical protein COZ99_01580 [Parcubacteria group bacterium CG_4_8_14_3_um_filter_48_16]PIY78403.1 MAG: hypothetical protein COY83_00110 [Parcubacteria group bacterium CG_4_10_14_0_8_um_filter_48_154]PIZ76855.1 MAG: hypothetical protein COY03_04470 [bacterium CG_4_10_14_0_2_um_filter_